MLCQFAPPSRENVRVLRMAGIAQMPSIAWLASTDLGSAWKARISPPTLCDIEAGRFVIAVRGVQFTNGLDATIRAVFDHSGSYPHDVK